MSCDLAEVSTTTRSRRRRLVSAVGIALLIALASCSGDDGTIAVGDRSTTSAPSTTDAAAATTTPAADGFVPGSYPSAAGVVVAEIGRAHV